MIQLTFTKTILQFLTILLLLLTYLFPIKLSADESSTVRVALASVSTKKWDDTILGIGILEAYRQVILLPESIGKISKISFNSGDTVKKGQVLFELNVNEEAAQLEKLKAETEYLNIKYKRLKSLIKTNSVSQSEVDLAYAELKAHSASVQLTESTIAKKTTRAPFDGVVGINYLHIGDVVSQQTSLISIVDNTKMLINFTLDDKSYVKLSKGQNVNIFIDALKDKKIVGTLVAVEPILSKSHNIRAQALVANAQNELRPGLFARVSLTTPNDKTVLVIPETAISYSLHGNTVFTATKSDGDNGFVVHRRIVTVGRSLENDIEVLGGLSENDNVVVSGHLKLFDGMHVYEAARNEFNVSSKIGG
ncbi:efflux RND transporter periplasmic adaptor subunit [Shewanella baltica]|uniref:efflux RND transporter periplasmic adaptor subunit n=1 Tax=Shewanella baltica TaxID=62322 RepID=UPI00217D7958|nr:efflux RND transporter periplasmic adaptor subunit [Shewanella baltica]MCS6192566.1 efflux RND transporter periplasmic adaptor subunit [Shewanella baltica]